MGIEQYIGRTVDVLAFQGGRSGNGEVLLRQELLEGASGGFMTTGIQKLAQRFLLKMFTEEGSMIHLPDEGSRFMTDARTGTLRTALDVEASFAEALLDVQRQLQLEELATDPDDEKFAGAEILSVNLANARATIRVRVEAVSGNSTEFIAPIEVTL